MTSRKSSSLNFQSLARESAIIERTFAKASFDRFAQLECELLHDELKVGFSFAMQGDRPMLSTSTTVAVRADCQWCLEMRPVDLKIDVSTLLAGNDEQAAEWSQELMQGPTEDEQLPVVVASEIDIDLLSWFEDELLLAWPVPVCVEQLCERRPAASYGDEPTSDDSISPSRQAFAQLAQLKGSTPNTD